MNRRSVSDLVLPAGWMPAILALGIIGQVQVTASPRGEESRLSSAVSSALATLGREKSHALVRIRCRDDEGELVGSGFLISPTGTVCTLMDFVRGENGLTVETGGKSFPATLLSADSRTGLAFLRTAASAPCFIPPSPSADLPVHSPLAALESFASENGSSVPLLGLTGARIDHDGERFFPVPLLTALLPAPTTRPGTPVFDLAGKFAGIVVRSSMNGDSCAILPAVAVEKLYGDLLRFGKANPGWIGAVVEETAVPEGTSRTRIAAVEPGSPADRAGVLPGDTLLAIGNRAIVMPQEVLEASFYLTAGQEVRLLLSRSGEPRRITLRCDPLPVETPPLRQ